MDGLAVEGHLEARLRGRELPLLLLAVVFVHQLRPLPFDLVQLRDDRREGIPPAVDRMIRVRGRDAAGFLRVVGEQFQVSRTVVVLHLRRHVLALHAGQRIHRFIDAVLQ